MKLENKQVEFELLEMPCWKIKTRVGIALAAFTIDASWREVQQIINNNNCNNRAAAAAAVMNKFLYLQLRRLPWQGVEQNSLSGHIKAFPTKK